MGNVRNAPIFLTPQVTRGMLGIGHPKRVVELEVKTLTDVVRDARRERKA